MGLSFTTAAGPRQRSHSHVRVSRDSWPHFTGGPGPLIYIPKKRVAQLYPPPALGFLFVASYDSQGYGEGIRPRHHIGLYSLDTESVVK
jgi:hypothetical protein